MFQRLMDRAGAVAARRARRRRAALAQALGAAAPVGVRVEEREEGVVLSGQGLRRRWVTDPSLRALAEAVR